MDRHRVDADPDLDPNFHVDAANLERHQNDADPHVNLISSFTHARRLEFSFTFIHSNASPQRRKLI
jgi:hypothetical protein